MDPVYEFLQRMFIAVGVGAMIGIEREYSKRQRMIGMRSFALVSFIGCISGLLASRSVLNVGVELALLPYIGLAMVIGYSFIVYYFMAEKRDRLGITTVLALPLTYLFGMLIGFGFLVEAVAAAVLVTILLYSRRYSHVFVEHLTEDEIADALQLLAVIFIVYPLLPAEPFAFLGLQLLLRRVVETIVLFSLISFAGFLALRLVGQKALPLAGFFAGFVSALSVSVSYSALSKKHGADYRTLSSGVLAANSASILSDIVILAYVNSVLLVMVALPLGIMLAVLAAAAAILRHGGEPHKIVLKQPFSVRNAATFGLAFFAVTTVLQLLSGQGTAISIVSLLGGAVSVTPVVTSLALAAGGSLGAGPAARAVMLAVTGGMLAKSGVLFFSASPELRKVTVPLLLGSAAIGVIVSLLMP